MVDPARSRIMSAIKGKDTKPELALRKALHGQGYRYRLHAKSLPGRPDLVFPKYNSIVLVNGCFWHKHHCHLFNPKRKLSSFWSKKIQANADRDKRNQDYYIANGWRVMVVWECAVVGKTKLPFDVLLARIASWLEDNKPGFVEVSGV